MKEIEITRQTVLGASLPDTDPDKPYYIGTIQPVIDSILSSDPLAAEAADYSVTWFVRLNARWYRVLAGFPAELIFHNGKDFLHETVTVQIEYNEAAAALGKLAHGKTSEKKASTSAANGRLGGRPKKDGQV